MKRPEGGFETAYNAQAAVDDLRQIIVAADVGKKIYAKRKHIIEPVFGVIKHKMKRSCRKGTQKGMKMSLRGIP